MQAVILAGGLGTRLRPITERIPKPMVEVGGRPFLEYIIRHLQKYDFRKLLVLLSYLGEHIQEHFGDGSRFGVDIEYSWEPSPLGTAGAIRNAEDLLDAEFMVIYGDSFLPIDYRRVQDCFQKANSLGLVVAYDNKLGDTGVQNNVALDADGYVVRYEKGTENRELKYVEAGVLCFRREVFGALPSETAISLEQQIYPQLISQRQLRAFITRQKFFDIGTHDRLEEFAAAHS